MKFIKQTLGLFTLLFILTGGAALAASEIYTGTFSDTAVSGYDAVAYFTQGEPAKGSNDFQTEYKGVAWKFASQENLDLFKADPEKYAPQYGGYCAYAVAQGTTASADPLQWKIVDEKLYLNYNADIRKRWEQDIPGYIVKANSNWPKLME